jgi:hypothetical protein
MRRHRSGPLRRRTRKAAEVVEFELSDEQRWQLVVQERD